jgi:hypothetical protein
VVAVIEQADDRAAGGVLVGRGLEVAVWRHGSSPSNCAV